MDPDEGLVQVNGPAVEKVWMLLVVPETAVKPEPSPANPAAINVENAG
jgi:hypothetical protein